MAVPTKLPPQPPAPTGSTQRIPAGDHGDLDFSGKQNQKIVFDPGARLLGRVTLSNCLRCEFDFGWCKSDNAWNAVKMQGGNIDCWLHSLEVVKSGAIPLLTVNGGHRNWYTDMILGPSGDADAGSPETQKHSSYFGSGAAETDGVIGNMLIGPQKYGYGIQFYEEASRMVITSCTIRTPGHSGSPRDDIGIGVILGGSSRENVVANTVGIDCRRDLVMGGAGSQNPAIYVRACAEIRCGHYTDGNPSAVSGSPFQLSSESELKGKGDPAWRLPWDPRVTHDIGAFGKATGSTPSPPPTGKTVEQLLAEAMQNDLASSYFKVPFTRDNATLAAAVKAYLSGGTRPSASLLARNKYALARVLTEDARRGAS